MLILHIGTHKTGTSALQSFLLRHAETLDAGGVHYLKAGLNGGKAHHDLSWSLRGMRDAKLSVWDEVRAELAASRSPVNVISSEAMWFTDPAAVRSELKSCGDVQIVMYLRRQDKYLQSLYKQTVKGGRKLPFDEWRERFSFRGDYLKVVAQWAEHFGAGALSVRAYERSGQTIDVISDFVSRLGLDDVRETPVQGKQKPGRRNPSPRYEVLHFIRAFNQLDIDVDRDKFVHAIMKKNAEYIRSGDLLTQEECSTLMASFESDNRTLSEKYYRESAPLFPEARAFTPPEIWRLDQGEFFQLTVDFLETLTEIAGGDGFKPKGPKKAGRAEGKSLAPEAGAFDQDDIPPEWNDE